jgi:hypothetical protein
MNHHEQSEALKRLLAEQKPTPRWYARTSYFVRTMPGALGWLMSSAGIVAISLLLVTCAAKAAVPSDRLIEALVKVESNGDPRAIGDNGKAYGCLQIWSVVVQDVNEVSRVKYTHADAFDPVKARAICRAYLARYATAKRLGREPTNEDFARIWNGGPNGHKKKASLSYWHKVAAVL